MEQTDTLQFLRTTAANVDRALADENIPQAREEIAKLRVAIDGDIYLTTGQAADRLGVKSINTVKSLVRAGKLDAHRGGETGRFRIPLSSLLVFIETPAFHRLQHDEREWDAIEALGMTDAEAAEQIAIDHAEGR